MFHRMRLLSILVLSACGTNGAGTSTATATATSNGATSGSSTATSGTSGSSSSSSSGAVSASASSSGGSSGSSGNGGPAAPTDLTLFSQTPSSSTLTWTAATGAASYNVYRAVLAPDGGWDALSQLTKYDTTTRTIYTDANAARTVSSLVNWGYVGSFTDGPMTIYRYAVSAVDAQGREGPLQTLVTAWMFHGQSNFLSGDYDYGGTTSDYASTNAPIASTLPYSIEVSGAGGAQPYSGIPNIGPQYVPGVADAGAPGWDMEVGAFNYMVVDLLPTTQNESIRVTLVTRDPPGDVFTEVAVHLPCMQQGDIGYLNGQQCFGPNPMVEGQWNHYKVPLNYPTSESLVAKTANEPPSLGVGIGSFVASLSSSQGSCKPVSGFPNPGVMTVTSVADGGVSVQASSWITGPGVAPDTYVIAQNASGGPGSYCVIPAQDLASTTLTLHRTNMYKMQFITSDNATYYLNNWGFTSE